MDVIQNFLPLEQLPEDCVAALIRTIKAWNCPWPSSSFLQGHVVILATPSDTENWVASYGEDLM